MEQVVYLIVVTILTYHIVRQYTYVDFSNPERNSSSNLTLGIAVVILMIFLLGLMPLTGFYTSDRANYVSWYVLYRGTQFHFNWELTNYLFDNAFEYVACNNFPPEYLFLPISVIYFGCMFRACNKFFSKDGLLAFVVYLGAFSTYSYGMNGVKAGAAASLFLIAIAYREKKLVAALFLFLSLGFHHSMMVCLAAFLLPYFVKNRKYYLYGWILCLVLAALGVTSLMSFFGEFANEGGANYLDLNKSERDVSGFRPDFILYSAIPIFLGEYLVRKFEIESEEYDFIWKVYVAANAVFLICTYASYINRIAYLSWQLYPIVLLYPFLHCDLGLKQYTYLKYAVYGHLGFTLFMDILYY